MSEPWPPPTGAVTVACAATRSGDPRHRPSPGRSTLPARRPQRLLHPHGPRVTGLHRRRRSPPLAPRGGGVVIEGVTVAGHSLSCRPGSWSNSPAFTYAFINSANHQVLQQGPSPTYALSEADVGRAILCQVAASNAGGTGLGRTVALAAVRPAPPPPPPPLPAVPQSPAGSGGSASGGGLGPTPQHVS